MPALKIAHIREKGVDLIIVPLDPLFGEKSEADQRKTISEIGMAARSAGLAGTVVPVWDVGQGRMKFRAPEGFHPFFRSISLVWVRKNLNRTLSW